MFNKFKLTKIQYGAEEISLFELTPLDQSPLASISAGSHLDIRLSNGDIRQYSLITPLCNAQQYCIAVKRDTNGRGGSLWLHDKVRVGDIVELSEPRNNFALNASQAPVILLAGGIGITPLYSMYHELKNQGRNVELHHWSHSTAQCLFHQELSTQTDVHLYISEEAAQRPSVTDIAQQSTADTEIYCCGPARMINALDEITPQLGAQRVYVERFQAEAPASTDTDSFTVVLAKSGKEVSVAAGQSILDALRDEDIDVMYSCEQGLCGACEQIVLEGDPIHQDSVFSPEEHISNNTIMICCSTSASSRLVLDI